MLKEQLSGLKRVLGLPSLFAAAIGMVVGQACFVSVLQGVGAGGATFFVALFIAFVLTLCYTSTFAELSLMMPKAGGISTYTLAALGPFPAIIATITGYVIPNILVSPAELFLIEEIFGNLFPGMLGYLGLFLVFLFTVLNILGIDLFSKVQNLLAYSMVVALVLLGVVGLFSGEKASTPSSTFLHDLGQTDGGVLSLVVLAFWAFMGLEYICPLMEETKNPERNIPRTFLAASVVLLLLYSLLAWVGMVQVPAETLRTSSLPHWELVNQLFDKGGTYVMAVLVITATSTSINTVMATVPRMLYGMAQHNQLPAAFKKLHPRWNTPWFSILVFSGLIFVVVGIFRGAQDLVILLIISSATAWLLSYIIAHVDLMVLRRKYPRFKRPFTSPLYPLPQIVGIAGIVLALIYNAPTPEMTLRVYGIFALFTGATTLYAFVWVRYKMKTRLFETEAIEEVLEETAPVDNLLGERLEVPE